MAILIDDPLWFWRGRRWCHVVSDANLDELHAFVRPLGVPERGFQGDHYDLPEELHAAAIQAGAQHVTSRELLRRLRAANLRLTPAQRRERGTSRRPA